MSLVTTTFNIPTLKIGLGGNYYVVCDWKEKLIELCNTISKSPNSVYFNKKYGCWAIRVKNKPTKERLLTTMSEGYIMLH
jgi:hypothetical protein